MPLDYGKDFIDKYRKKDEERYNRRTGFSRFKVNKGSSSTFVMLDDVLIHTTEHRVYKDGKNYFKTCLGDDRDCPYCAQAPNSKNISTTTILIAGTVINTTGFVKTEEDGTLNHIRNYKQNLVLKGGARNEFLHQRAKVEKRYGEDKPMMYTVWEARRGDDERSLNTGEHFDFRGKYTKETIIERLKEAGVEKDDWESFFAPDNYEETFKEESLEEARRFLGLSAQTTRIGSTAITPPPDEISTNPFDMDNDDTLLEDEDDIKF